MPYYVDLNNKTHFLDSEDYEHLLPEGSRRMNTEEAQEVLIKNSLTSEDVRTMVVRRKIVELEASVTQRRLRDAILSGDLSFVEGVDAKIAQLRDELANPPALSDTSEELADFTPMQPDGQDTTADDSEQTV